jgi:FKBP-type peptidyl-prolyl cis-trans isomerase FkpA
MKSNALKLFLVPAALVAMATGCKNSSSGGFETDAASGMQYHFFNHADNGQKPAMGDYAEVMLTLKNSKDSIIFNSAHREGVPDSIKTVKLHLKNSFKGCLADGIVMMAVGDSGSFIISADSLYEKTFHAKNLPSFVQAGTMLTCNVKLVKVETEEQGKAEREKKMQEREAITAQRKANEESEISKYLGDNHLTVKPAEDGMYILKDEKGKGKGIKEGDSVEVEYTATLLDGTIVEQSNHGDSRTSYFVSYKKENGLKGIDDALAMMKEGESIKALFPSALAFGGQQQGILIEPYTPLIFEIKVVKVKPGV